MYNLCKYLPKSDFSVITAKRDLAINLGTYDKNYVLDCNTIQLPVVSLNLLAQFKFLFLGFLSGLSLNKKKPLTHIFAVYPYDVCLFLGYLLHIVTKKPLIIYMHDLFTEARKDARSYKLLEFMEKKIFSAAATILVMNLKYKEHYLRRGFNNLTLFPPSIDLSENSPSKIGTPVNNKRKIKIVYTGSVYEAQEDAVLKFLEATKAGNAEVVFATPTKKGYLEDHLRASLNDVNVGFLPKKKCIELQRSADVLFLPLSSNSPYPEEVEIAFPCKLLEYLAAGKPILAVVPKGSFVEEFIKQYQVGIAVTELSIEKIAEAIEELKDDEKREMYIRNARKTVLLFDAEKQSKRLIQILENTTSAP